MTTRSRKYFQRKKPRPAYTFTFGGTGRGKSYYAQQFAKKNELKALAVDKDGRFLSLNLPDLTALIDYWSKPLDDLTEKA